ncbi:MAG: YceI family protein [Pseudoxanthomonas suwonensis]|nr:YceI family protein [Pseudoxanthomonas suwonensis]
MTRAGAWLAGVLVAAAPLLANASDWVQVDGSRLAFAGKYQGEVFTGMFPGFRTRLHFDPTQPEQARLEVDIPMAGVTTGNPEYDGEMRAAAFFDSAAFPQARFQAIGARPLADGRYAMDGTLRLRGISKPVTLTFEWTGGEQAVLFGRATLRRLEFGVGSGPWADTRMIPDEIAVSTRVRLVPAVR